MAEQLSVEDFFTKIQGMKGLEARIFAIQQATLAAQESNPDFTEFFRKLMKYPDPAYPNSAERDFVRVLTRGDTLPKIDFLAHVVNDFVTHRKLYDFNAPAFVYEEYSPLLDKETKKRVLDEVKKVSKEEQHTIPVFFSHKVTIDPELSLQEKADVLASPAFSGTLFLRSLITETKDISEVEYLLKKQWTEGSVMEAYVSLLKRGALKEPDDKLLMRTGRLAQDIHFSKLNKDEKEKIGIRCVFAGVPLPQGIRLSKPTQTLALLRARNLDYFTQEDIPSDASLRDPDRNSGTWGKGHLISEITESIVSSWTQHPVPHKFAVAFARKYGATTFVSNTIDRLASKDRLFKKDGLALFVPFLSEDLKINIIKSLVGTFDPGVPYKSLVKILSQDISDDVLAKIEVAQPIREWFAQFRALKLKNKMKGLSSNTKTQAPARRM